MVTHIHCPFLHSSHHPIMAHTCTSLHLSTHHNNDSVHPYSLSQCTSWEPQPPPWQAMRVERESPSVQSHKDTANSLPRSWYAWDEPTNGNLRAYVCTHPCSAYTPTATYVHMHYYDDVLTQSNYIRTHTIIHYSGHNNS